MSMAVLSLWSYYGISSSSSSSVCCSQEEKNQTIALIIAP